MLRSPWWPENEPERLPRLPGTMVDALARAAGSRPDHVATFYYGAAQSYGELHRRVLALTVYLRVVCGVRAGDRVVLTMQNAPQYVIAFHAILRADAVIVPISPMYRTDEMCHIVEDSGARIAIIASELIPEVLPIAGTRLDHVIVARYGDMLPTEQHFETPEVVSDSGPELPQGAAWHSWHSAMAQEGAPPEALRGPNDLCILPYTSGTTGKPKACMHTHSAMLYTAVLNARWFGIDEESVVTAFMPLFHVAGMQGSMNAAICVGATMVVTTRWNRELIPALFEAHGVTFWNAAPTMIVDVLGSPAFSERSFRRLRTIHGGGATMPETVAEALRKRFGLAFIEGYGLTETMSPTHINPPRRPKPQSLGIPVHETDARVIDPDTLRELGPNEIGEIIVHGPQIMLGYWNRPEANAESFLAIDGKGFLRTGDLGRYDEEGYFYAIDRLKRMINVSGYKVWPAEFEAMLYRHPAIRECCVIGAPDSYRGETVMAQIVLRDDFREPIEPADIIGWARAHMASYKVPRRVLFVRQLPRTASNKIDWRRLQNGERARGE